MVSIVRIGDDRPRGKACSTFPHHSNDFAVSRGNANSGEHKAFGLGKFRRNQPHHHPAQRAGVERIELVMVISDGVLQSGYFI